MGNSGNTSELAYEAFEMYGFSLEYPDTWEIELRPHSTAAAGDLAFKSRSGRVFLTWGSLEKVKKKFGSLDRQAEDGVKKMRKSGAVRRFEILDHREMNVNGHRSIFNSTRLTIAAGLMGMRTAQREVCSLHLHCDPSQKFFVLYANGIGEQSEGAILDVFFRMSSTLRCHQTQF